MDGLFYLLENITMKSLYIITGSSKGIGLALLKSLERDKNNFIVGIARSESKEQNENVRNLSLDLGNFDLLRQSFDQIFPEGAFENLVLINNAGWIGQIDHLGNLKAKSIRDIFNINTIAPAMLMNEFISRYVESSGNKTIINISSGAARKAVDGWSGYSSSKAALNMISEVAQEEADLDNTGIKVFAVAPGVVDTEMQSNIRSAPESGFSKLEKFKGLKSENALSSAAEAAEKILYLIKNRDQFKGVLQDVREF